MERIAVNEAALILEAQGGNVASFSALVECYQERAIRAAYSILGNVEDARDIAQEAFVKAFTNLGTFKAGSRFYTWFYRILVNACKDYLRKKKVRGFVLLCLGRREGETNQSDPILEAESPTRSAAEELLNKELGESIQGALSRLPFQQRTAFTLRYLDGLSIEEVAEAMALSAGAVKAHLWQAAQKMRRSLSGYLEMKEILS